MVTQQAAKPIKITLYSLELIVLKVDTLLCYTLIFTLQRFLFISIFHVSPRMEATILNQHLIYDSTDACKQEMSPA